MQSRWAVFYRELSLALMAFAIFPFKGETCSGFSGFSPEGLSEADCGGSTVAVTQGP